MKQCAEGQKHEAFLKYLCGHTPKEIADEAGVHYTTVYRWIDRWRESFGEHTLNELSIQDMGAILTHIAELQKQLDEQKRTITIIHESHILQSIPLKRRIDMAMQYLDAYPATQLSRIFEVKLSTLYYHMKITQEETNRQCQENFLRSVIASVFEESGRRFGAERIRLQLRNQGIRISKKRIIRLMKQMEFYNESPEQSYYPVSDAGDLEDVQDVQILQ